MREISANRESPCELIRELVSNAYDAHAKNILIFPLLEKKGIIFFDDGVGLSIEKEEYEIAPYDAFFSIGIEMKTRGETIGYKCQGAKLCFDSIRFSLITKCEDENAWRFITIENPRTTLHDKYDIEPDTTNDPANTLKSILKSVNKQTRAILNYLDQSFFESQFQQGTMVIIEGFNETQYEKYFSVESEKKSYLFNYIKFYTIHGDMRLIKKEHGFQLRDIQDVTDHILTNDCQLKVWMRSTQKNKKLWNLEKIEQGFPYIKVTGKEKTKSPFEIGQLRAGRFYERGAMVFEFGGQYYTLILAIDGKRRALTEYDQLGRQGKSTKETCGITLSSQQGVWLSAQGVKICQYDKLFDSPLLEDFSVLRSGTEHYMFIIDGDFELTTNRNSLTANGWEIVENNDFIKEIRNFLISVSEQKNQIFQELLLRLRNENTEHTENEAIEKDKTRKSDLTSRDRFYIRNVDVLAEKFFVGPLQGEEHFVGALYTLFSHVISSEHELFSYWKRPLTFSGKGTDSIAVNTEKNELEAKNLISVEYKYFFAKDDEFNHLLTIIDTIVCWEIADDVSVGDIILATSDYLGEITKHIEYEGTILGFTIGNIKKIAHNRASRHEIKVLSLKNLIDASFDIEWIPGIVKKISSKKRK
jgi:hypothetical protein